ncbi:hypothetical protein [Mesorhizobium sp. ANAO-SY3R2]|uniref:hypothetical protein n=1 Tax=Mesorhizobium sp. ANAO-SY3R2 TaxID=3166644 RepID=UPI00366E6471
MAWGRGFFRLWVMLSALWVAFSVLMYWERITDPAPIEFAFTFRENSPVAIEAGSPEHATLLAQRKAGGYTSMPLASGDRAFISTKEELNVRVHQLMAIQDAHGGIRTKLSAQTFRRNLGEALQMAAFVPGMLLALGFGIGWIASGFRRQDMAAD